MKALLESALSHPRTERIVLAVILVNALTLGLETSQAAVARFGAWLYWVDVAVLVFFCCEILAKLYVRGLRFFRDAWNVFDFIVVAIALVPASGPLTVLRALRILRVLRLITVMPSLKRVVGALLGAIPGMSSIVLLLGLIFYVAGVMATKLFGETFPQWFGSLGASIHTLFQVMTLDSWSSGILRPVMEVHPLAWLFFVTFVLATSFTALNLFIGVVVSAMQSEIDAERQAAVRKAVAGNEELLLAEVRALRAEVAQMAGSIKPSP